MLSIICAECHNQAHYVECRYAQYRYAECRYAECCYAECRGNAKMPVMAREVLLVIAAKGGATQIEPILFISH